MNGPELKQDILRKLKEHKHCTVNLTMYRRIAGGHVALSEAAQALQDDLKKATSYDGLSELIHVFDRKPTGAPEDLQNNQQQ